MQEATPQVGDGDGSDDARLESLGYQPQLNRVLGLFANFSVAFTYLSPMVGIYSLFVLGMGTGGPAYVWLTWLPVAGMLLVALAMGLITFYYHLHEVTDEDTGDSTSTSVRIARPGGLTRPA